MEWWETSTQNRQVGLYFKTRLSLRSFNLLSLKCSLDNKYIKTLLKACPGRSLERGGGVPGAAAGGQQQLRRGRGGQGGGAEVQGGGQVRLF